MKDLTDEQFIKVVYALLNDHKSRKVSSASDIDTIAELLRRFKERPKIPSDVIDLLALKAESLKAELEEYELNVSEFFDEGEFSSDYWNDTKLMLNINKGIAQLKTE